MSLPTIDYRTPKPLQGSLKDLTKENFEKLKRVLDKRGFDIPLFLWKEGDTYWIVDGHQRQRVAKEIDLKPYEVPYIEVTADNIHEAKKRVLEISSQYGTITQEGYDEFTADLPELELQETVNFDALKWDTEPDVEEDEPPEVDDTNVESKLGEIYQLGRHRVMCGDSTDEAQIAQLMDGTKADMVFTDPPYGIGIDGQKESKASNPKHNRKGHDFRGWDSERPGKPLFDYLVGMKVPTAIFGGNYFADLLPPSRGWIYWGKGQDGDLSSSDGELVWTNLDKPLRSVIGNRGELQGSVHPTQKPLGVVSFCLTYLGEGSVLDLFLGSGSTLIACEQLDRTCYGMELDPKYVDVIRKRYWKYINDDNEDGWVDNTPAITGKEQVGANG